MGCIISTASLLSLDWPWLPNLTGINSYTLNGNHLMASQPIAYSGHNSLLFMQQELTGDCVGSGFSMTCHCEARQLARFKVRTPSNTGIDIAPVL